MATIYFYKGVDANDATNYNTAWNGSGSTGLPSAGDTLVITTPNELNAGLTALSAIALHDVYLNGPTTVVAGSSLSLAVASTYTFYFNGTAGSSGSGTFSVTCGTGGIANINAAPQGGNLQIVAGTTTNLFVFTGQVNIAGAATVTNVYNYGGTVVAVTGAGTTTLIETTGGYTSTTRSATTINCQGSSVVTTLDGSAFTTINILGGTVNTRSVGTNTTINLKVGTLTPLGATLPVPVTTLNLFGTSATTTWVKTAGSGTFNVSTTNNFGGQTGTSYNPGPGS